MISTLKNKIAKNYVNFRGWKTNRKLLLIESDDWGAIRMPSKRVYDFLVKNNIMVDKLHIDKFDSLEGMDDLNELYDILRFVKDMNGHTAILTAFFVVANPKFEEIQNSNFKEYSFELITETYNRNNHTQNSFDLVLKGMSENIFYPQFHGREHLHPKRWMEALNLGYKKEIMAFDNKAIISSQEHGVDNFYVNGYLHGLDYFDAKELLEQSKNLKMGFDIFYQLFGIKSISFTPQGSIISPQLYSDLKDFGVKLLPGQLLAPDGKGGYKKLNKFWGEKNEFDQLYWRRNCRFEPSRDQNFDWVDSCLREIDVAFFWGKPAVISSHRENFIGSIFPENRIESLKKLKELLNRIVKKWPDVEFINTAQLAEIMLEDLTK